ncbi:MAG TPA: class I SAM-dependent rRNA methyltransferase [Terriglobales bacterium]|nr:class I SAM-dependent rRNA methyltransferase [Terriglobales bacterium]
MSRRGAERVRGGHVWIYRSDVVTADGVPPGSAVLVKQQGSKALLGTAFYSTASQIAVRMLSREALENIGNVLRQRVRAAVEYRKRLVRDTNAYRVIFSESDSLPGLIVDCYNDLLSMQVLNQAMDSETSRTAILSELQEILKPKAIIERSDARVRKLEQLPEKQSGLVAGEQTRTEFQMNGVRFIYDALSGQKTGAFLDQRENYAAAEQYARGEALDVFCYQGGFALHLARCCERVTGVDSSLSALEAAEANSKLNGREIEWIEANAFDLLRDYSDSGRQYDSIVLDPPAFAKTREKRDTALRGYKELNLRALKMLRPGGVLMTCSCSFHVSGNDLLEALGSAAGDAGRPVRVLELRGQAKDHPQVLGIPETAYLKCIISIVR